MSSDPATESPARPVTTAERLVTLDFIRGVAVLGILIANVVGMAYPYLAYEWPPAMGRDPGTGDAAVWLAQYVLIDGKMRGLFTLLFGAGMYLFLERAWARGQSEGLQARRLAWLTGFTGSAGMAVVLKDRAALFTDGRYTLQARDEVYGERDAL